MILKIINKNYFGSHKKLVEIIALNCLFLNYYSMNNKKNVLDYMSNILDKFIDYISEILDLNSKELVHSIRWLVFVLQKFFGGFI